VDRSLVRIVSVALLAIVASLSAARALCLLPCLLERAPRAPQSAHCGHEQPEREASLRTHEGSCDACGELGIRPADRLTSRSSIEFFAAPSRQGIDTEPTLNAARSVLDWSPPRGLRPSGRAPLPLRI
jgi:hypothetical protein